MKIVFWMVSIAIIFLGSCEKNRNSEISFPSDISTTKTEIEYSADDYRTVIVNGKKFVLGVNNIENDKIIIKGFNLMDYPEYYTEDGSQSYIGIRIPNTSKGIVFNYIDNVLGGIAFEGLIDPKIIKLPEHDYQNFGSAIGYKDNGVEVLVDPELTNGTIIYYIGD